MTKTPKEWADELKQHLVKQEVPEIIICAALKHGDDIFCGVRHGDPIMLGQIQAAYGSRPAGMESGFLSNHYQFLNRQEAWKVAEKAGQIKHRVGGDTSDGGTLYSENLY